MRVCARVGEGERGVCVCVCLRVCVRVSAGLWLRVRHPRQCSRPHDVEPPMDSGLGS